MGIVYCEIVHGTDENDDGVEVDCVMAVCPRCGCEETAWGDSEASILRALVTLKENCDCESDDFYKEKPAHLD